MPLPVLSVPASSSLDCWRPRCCSLQCLGFPASACRKTQRASRRAEFQSPPRLMSSLIHRRRQVRPGATAGRMRVSRWSSTPTSNARSAARTSPCSNAGSTNIPRSPGSGITCRCRCTSPRRPPTRAWSSASVRPGGHAAFWQAVEWVYAHTRGDGQGLPEGLTIPTSRPTRSSASTPERPDAVIRAQAAEAASSTSPPRPRCACRTAYPARRCCCAGRSTVTPCCRPSTCWPQVAPMPHQRRKCLPSPSATCPGSHDLQGYDAPRPR